MPIAEGLPSSAPAEAPVPSSGRPAGPAGPDSGGARARLAAAPWRFTPSGIVAALGLGAAALYAYLSLLLVPMPFPWVDTEHFTHFAKVNFDYGGSLVDLSGMSPVQGMGGLIQPLAVWLNPMYLFSHVFPSYDPRLWGLLAVVLLMLAATYLLGRAMGLPAAAAVFGAQAVAMFSFPPLYPLSVGVTRLNGAHLFTPLPGFALPVTLEILWLAIFCFLGRSPSRKVNLALVALFPAVFVYCVVCDPLYTALFIIPIVVVMGGVYLGSGSKPVFLWRTVGGAVLLAVCLALQIPQFFLALTGYAARAVFPNELYVEIQKWDFYTGLFFQGGLMPWLMALMLGGCLATLILGGAQARGFAAATMGFSLAMVVVNLHYVYSGVRWSQPLPAYLETGVQPAYVVAGLLGAWLLGRRLWSAAAPRLPALAAALAAPRARLVPSCALALALPLFGISVAFANHPAGFSALTAPPAHVAPQPAGFVKFLRDEIGISGPGRFRGSVANVAGVPGGEILNRRGVSEAAPFSKEMIEFLGQYFRSFDPNFYMTGLWSLGIPTLEDNNHLVTPPFHYLVSRALSRPQDYHSRNWAWISRAEPRLMAALGARYLLADRDLADPLLALRQMAVNYQGVRLRVYEIAGANVGNLSPTRTVVSTNADQTLSLLTSGSFPFDEVAVVHDAELTGLTRARSDGMFYERGGVRVRASSPGRSLLVLPVQFSNSLRVVASESRTSGPVRLVRVNLLETGVLFEGTIDVKITHAFGPFRGVAGRRRDIEDCRRLGIRENGRIAYPPYYQPLAGKWPRFLAPLAALLGWSAGA